MEQTNTPNPPPPLEGFVIELTHSQTLSRRYFSRFFWPPASSSKARNAENGRRGILKSGNQFSSSSSSRMSEKERRNFGEIVITLRIFIQWLITIDEEFRKLRKKIDTKILLVFLYSDNFSQEIDKETTHKNMSTRNINKKGGGKKNIKTKGYAIYIQRVLEPISRGEASLPFSTRVSRKKKQGMEGGGGGGGGRGWRFWGRRDVI